MKFIINKDSNFATIGNKDKSKLKSITGCRQEELGSVWYNTFDINSIEDLITFDVNQRNIYNSPYYSGLLIDFENKKISIIDE